MEWRPVPGYEGRYEVSDEGQVRSLLRFRTPRLRKTWTTKSGYLMVVLDKNGSRCFKDGSRKNHFVHLLVMLAFVGPKPSGYTTNHKNAIKADNRLSNLEYVPHRENIRHAYLFGLSPRGERHHNAVLTDTQVAEIRNSHEPTRELATRYGASLDSIWRIKTGRSRISK